MENENNSNFFDNAIDEALVDSAQCAFSNNTYDITNKQTTKWSKKSRGKNPSLNCHSQPQLQPNANPTTTTDRYIPLRDETHYDRQQIYDANQSTNALTKPDDTNTNNSLTVTNTNTNNAIPSTSTNSNDGTHAVPTNLTNDSEYKSNLKSSLFSSTRSHQNRFKILAFQSKAPEPTDGYLANLPVLYTTNSTNNLKFNASKLSTKVRHVSQTAERVLDAPDLLDDYYLNLLHWGTTNIIAIGLGSAVYLWNAENGQINLLYDYAAANSNTNSNSANSETYVCSVQWNHNAQYIAVGTSDGIVSLFDHNKNRILRRLQSHNARIGALSWNHCILSTGSADSTIRHNDVRNKNHLIATLQSHEQEICGLTWNDSVNGEHLASGSNDNSCCIWELRNYSAHVHQFTDCLSAVKALAFCPWNSNLLATGGGSGDRKIRIYDTQSGNLCNWIDSQSQICSLIWNPFEKELLSSHGFSKNQLAIWKYPSMKQTHELTGHTARVLHTSLAPNGEMVCSAAADETLRFWKVFENNNAKEYERNGNGVGGKRIVGKSENNVSLLNMKIR